MAIAVPIPSSPSGSAALDLAAIDRASEQRAAARSCQRAERAAADQIGEQAAADATDDPARDYRDGAQYRERVVSPDERVYAGYDGRYYCKRSDGTTGLIIGGAAGGILGNVIDGGRSRILGTLLGGAAGALAGRSIDQNSQVRCR
ncbi:glycine zipper 2TM domain-containing protein [Sphingomonas abaci]|uniref:glycine zipper 2TM domain-containing protein n=1 Tax=Sphingomonas abaci TaxID=237611 RepID=UPI003CCCB05A